jgi:hypothetical protein
MVIIVIRIKLSSSSVVNFTADFYIMSTRIDTFDVSENVTIQSHIWQVSLYSISIGCK